jgi:hypothetical protein
LSTLFPPLRQVAPPAQKFVDERPLLQKRQRNRRKEVIAQVWGKY